MSGNISTSQFRELNFIHHSIDFNIYNPSITKLTFLGNFERAASNPVYYKEVFISILFFLAYVYSSSPSTCTNPDFFSRGEGETDSYLSFPGGGGRRRIFLVIL